LHLSVVEDTKELVEVARKIQMERREEQMKRDHLARMKVLAESRTFQLWDDTLPVILHTGIIPLPFILHSDTFPPVNYKTRIMPLPSSLDPYNFPLVNDHTRTFLLPSF